MLELPLTVELSDHTRATFDRRPPDRDPQHTQFQVVMETRVDPRDLELVRDTGSWLERPDGSREKLSAVRLKHGAIRIAHVTELLNPLTFLTDVPFRASVSFEERAEFVAETEQDAAVIKDLGTSEAYAPLSGQVRIRTISPAVVNAKAVEPLLPKAEGLQLYADALLIEHPVGRFRELWRVLESAFGAQDDELLSLLERFEPAREIGFRERELRRLHVLRGRASHARSKSGIAEVRAVTGECEARCPRLKSLVERVIATKKTWGVPSLAAEALFPLRGYVGPDDEADIVVFRQPVRGADEA